MATRRLAAGLLQHSLGHQTASIFVKNTGVRHLFVSRAVAAVHAIEVPVMGESITEGTLDVILKQPGDAVQQDEVICTIATDKVRFSVCAGGVFVCQALATLCRSGVLVLYFRMYIKLHLPCAGCCGCALTSERSAEIICC